MIAYPLQYPGNGMIFPCAHMGTRTEQVNLGTWIETNEMNGQIGLATLRMSQLLLIERIE